MPSDDIYSYEASMTDVLASNDEFTDAEMTSGSVRRKLRMRSAS